MIIRMVANQLICLTVTSTASMGHNANVATSYLFGRCKCAAALDSWQVCIHVLVNTQRRFTHLNLTGRENLELDTAKSTFCMSPMNFT